MQQHLEGHRVAGLGPQVALHQVRPDLPIVLMTGYTDQRERAFGLKTLIHDIVQKPFSLAEIRQTLTEALAA